MNPEGKDALFKLEQGLTDVALQLAEQVSKHARVAAQNGAPDFSERVKNALGSVSNLRSDVENTIHDDNKTQ